MTNAGYHLVQTRSPLHLSAKILSLRCDSEDTGFWGPSKAYCTLQVEFTLTNDKIGRQLWDEAIFAKGESTNENLLADSLNVAMNKIANDFAANKFLQSKL